jgi:RNA polymerase sigma factor (sigma-70 family)
LDNLVSENDCEQVGNTNPEIGVFCLIGRAVAVAQPGSITHWLKQLKDGERAAAQQLWEAYVRQLLQLARKKLQGLPPQLADAEDVALSAFKSFCLAAEQNRLPRLEDRHDLWQVLVMLTRNKAGDMRDYHRRGKRDHRRAHREADTSPAEFRAFSELLQSGEPDPGFAVEVAEQCQRLLQGLPDESLRQIALRKLEGYTNAEIAGLLHCAPATVERRLARIRSCWRSLATAE